VPLVSPATKLLAWLTKATYRPSPLIDGALEYEFACPPLLSTLTRVVVPVRVSRRKMSAARLVSPATRLLAELTKATYRPSLLIEGALESEFACWPLLSTLPRVVVPFWRSRTKMSDP